MSGLELEQATMPGTAVVLAGGLGTRLRPAVPAQPTVLAPAAGRPFLHYLLRYLAGQGLEKVILSVGYLAGQVRAFVGDGHAWGVSVEYSQEDQPLGTGGALRLASTAMKGSFFALNGDTLFTVDLQALFRTHQAAGRLATLALLPAPDGRSRGCVRLDAGGQVIAFDEKPTTISGEQVLVNGGLYVLEPEALTGVKPGQMVSLEREVFPVLAARRQLAGAVQPAYFADIGTPDSLAAFENDVRAGRLP